MSLFVLKHNHKGLSSDQREKINKATELTKNLLETENRGYYQILFKEQLKVLGDKENE